MVIYMDDIMKIPEIMAECKATKVTVVFSLGGAFCTSCCSVVGGLIAGPAGLLAGAAVGGFTSYAFTRNKFKSLYHVYHEDLTLEQKERLKAQILKAFRQMGLKDLVQIAALIANDTARLKLVIEIIKSFLKDEFKGYKY